VSIIWFLAGFVLCFFMPASVQMIVKNIVSGIYNRIRYMFGKGSKDIAW